ncbi:MAG: hypothetical protein Q7J21_01445 [Rugosibacter sp.]|nr:hypothetical protein [Rugosibacter sp.]
MILDLPSTGTEQPPAFTTIASCHDWLKTLPLSNAMQAQVVFLRQLALLARFTLPIAERFAVLEELRRPIRQVQDVMAKKFMDRPLPLSPSEQAALDSTLTLWQSLFTNYLHCFAEHDTLPIAPSRKNATVAQRALATLADWQVALIQGKRLPDLGFWKKLHQIFFLAEAADITEQQISDPLRYGKQTVTPLAVYAECHLLHIANPHELSSHHLAWIIRWTQRWGGKIKRLKAPPEDISLCAHPLWVDLDSDLPANYIPRQSAQGRWLETTDLRTSLASRLALLEQGQSPMDLHLGSDVTQPAVGRLLARLLSRWCQGGNARKPLRRGASGSCRLIPGYNAVHFHLSGQRTFQSATQDDETRRLEKEKFALFGDSSHRLDIAKPAAPDPTPIETWVIMGDWTSDTSATGLRISRPIRDGGRIAAGTLIATCTEQSPGFVLGCVRWTLRQNNDSLAIGIQLFPGETQAIMARPIDPERTAYRPAFFIAANATANQPASLVLPVGSFQIGRRIEIMKTSAEIVTLTHLVAHGSEFELCTFAAQAHA